jgi:hypothetical protein
VAKIESLSIEIAKQLSLYTESVKEEIELASDEITREVVKRLKVTSPKLTGDYSRGWTRKKCHGGWVIYNKNKGQLTHLAENGHANRGGGRTPGKPHIKPAEEEAINKFNKRIEKAVQG